MDVLLSFDIEEFDYPRERGADISVDDGVKVSAEGLEKILKILKNTGVRATFFVTGNFANRRPDLVKRMIREGHEVAAHGVNHFAPQKADIEGAKKILEPIAGEAVVGWRQPRMQKIDYQELAKRGYKYDSSTNPAFIPGRYNNLHMPRKPYCVGGSAKILEIPTAVATIFRIPLFWLALHLFPFWLYNLLAKISLRETGKLAIYFHPWEFTNLTKFNVVPWYIRKNCDEKLVVRLEKLINSLKKSGGKFIRYKDLLN